MKKIVLNIYSIYCYIILLATFILLAPFAIIALFFGKYTALAIYKIAAVWGILYGCLVGVFWKNIGTTKPNAKKPYIFVANHNSYYDIFSITLAIKQHYRVLGKEEPTKIPIFGWFYKNCIITVNRSSDEDRRKSVMHLKKHLAKNTSVCIFPEGTFNNTDGYMKAFYDGAFRIALETNTSIQPLVFFNNHKFFNWKHPLQMKPGIAYYAFLPEIPQEDLQNFDIHALKEYVFSQMEQKLMAFEKTNK
jgi:1-acyl-sn-glycerol-3-phosphate acyltransferase